ncbi:MAG TPA: hypothetical protein VN436_10955 [Holophaga sp.]|nr:hypothetical protein [Holophaga sp.]
MLRLQSIEEAGALIRTGAPLMLAGEEALLRELPPGNWIGGTTAYFMTHEGCVADRKRLFVKRFPDFVKVSAIRSYAVEDLPRIPSDYPGHGCSWIILPGASEALLAFGRSSTTYAGLFNQPLVGWVSGIHLDDLGKRSPKVVDGSTGSMYENRALVMHTCLPPRKTARVELLNLFQQGGGPAIRFPEGGFRVQACSVGGAIRNLAEYIATEGIDTQLPLVTDFAGACINVSIQSVDAATGTVDLYAAVFPDSEYHFAAPVADYPTAFERELSDRNDRPSFSCNCILNYLYAHLDGRKISGITGPITNGEIAYILLNQTVVYTVFEDLDTLAKEGPLSGTR